MSDGKWLEKKVKELFDKEALKQRFAYERLYDARAARGKFPPQASDFLVNCVGDVLASSVFVECKETENESQISIGDFPQFPRIYIKMLAGARGVLVVYHTKIKKFRVVDLSNFPLSTSIFKLGSFPFVKLEYLLEVLYKQPNK